MADITLQQAQEKVDQWIRTYGVRYFNELTNMTILTEEVGELARIMARTYGEQSFKESDKNRDLGDEMADVLWVLICLANQTGVDLTAAFEKNMQKKTSRDGCHTSVPAGSYAPPPLTGARRNIHRATVWLPRKRFAVPTTPWLRLQPDGIQFVRSGKNCCATAR